MNIVTIRDKDKAQMLIRLGHKCYETQTNEGVVYNFYATNELLNTLNTKFAYGDYIVSKLCYM